MTRDELNKILESGESAKLVGADLENANLRDVNLQGADLRAANLECANLQGADLRGANLQYADLQDADLRGANLYMANMEYASLWGANMENANLRDACLLMATLVKANLKWADLLGADITSADLRGADLRDVDLTCANMNGVKTNTRTKIDWRMVCPESGSFIGWKKAGKYIVKLEIPADAKRSSANSRKCRASMAKVLEIQNKDGTKADVTEVKSDWGGIYKLGRMIYPDSWDDNRWSECSHGIHFFMTREEVTAW